jgi:Transposase Tn5 dimerisation domain/Transposase DNA-binding
MIRTIPQWAAEEAQGADFGDERLSTRFALLLGQLGAKPSLSILAAAGGNAEAVAAYRFFANPAVTPEAILAPHREATLRRIASLTRVLLVQDTTEIDLTRPREVVGGPLDEGSRHGLFDHPLVASTPDGTPLGVVHARLWARPEPKGPRKSRGERKKEYRKKPLEEKESFRWLEGHRQADRVAGECPGTEVVCLSDSEGDLYECLEEARDRRRAGLPAARFIIRACQDRRVVVPEGRPPKCLFESVAEGPVLARAKLEVRDRPAKTSDSQKRKKARSARLAEVTVQSATVTLSPPERPDGRGEPVTVNAVLVRETGAPTGEPPLEWLLVTDLPVRTALAALAVVDDYCQRWGIEVYFRVLKGGCGVEEMQLETAKRAKAALALYMIVAWRVLWTLRLGRECPEMACDGVFAEEEWKALYAMAGKEVPHQAPPLGEVVEMVGRLGGWLGRKGDGPPGPKAMWIGLQRLSDFAAAWMTFGPGRGNARSGP